MIDTIIEDERDKAYARFCKVWVPLSRTDAGPPTQREAWCSGWESAMSLVSDAFRHLELVNQEMGEADRAH